MALILWWMQGIGQSVDTAAVREWLEEGRVQLDAGEFAAAAKAADRSLRAGLDQFPLLEAAARMLHGEVAQAQGQFDLAGSAFDSAWCLLQDKIGWDHPEMAVVLSDLGNYYYDLGYIREAYQYHTQALVIRQQLFGNRHPETAKSVNNIANCLLSIGDYDRAIALYREVADIRRDSPLAPAADLASAYNNLGSAFLAAGDLENAKNYYLLAMDLRRRILGPDHLKTAQSHQNVGNAFAALHQQDTALQHFGEALAVYEQYYGENHPRVAAIYENMGNALAEKQAYEAAGELQQKALDIRRRYYGQSHPDIIRSYQNIGELWMLRGDYQAALLHFRQALGILRRQWGDYHPQVAQAYEQVGLALLNTGEFQQGLISLEQVLALRQALFGPDHPFVAGTSMNIGNAYWQDGQYQQAREFYQRSLAIWSAGEGWQAEQLKALLNISRSYLEENRPALAQQMLSQANKLLDQADPIALAGYKRTMGQALLEQGLYPSADRWLEEALALLEFQPAADEISGKAPLEVLLCLQAKARNYLEWTRSSGETARADTALYWFEKAVEWLTWVQTGYLNPESRQRMTALNLELFSGAIETCFMLAETGDHPADYYRKALAFSDRNKGMRLLEAGLLRKRSEQAGAAELVGQLQQQTQEINRLEKRRILESGKLSDEDRRQLDGQLYELQQQKAALYQKLGPGDNNSQSGPDFLGEDGIRSVQEALAPDQAVMTFFSGKKTVCQFVLTRDAISARRLDPGFPLQQSVIGMVRSLVEYPDAPSGEKPALDSVYTDLAFRLYGLLFAPVEVVLNGKNTLTVIPDGILGWLPFEALLTEIPAEARRFRLYPYLVERFNISYAYSAGYWLSLKQEPVPIREKLGSCLAVAPDFSGNGQGFAPLEHNREEATAIGRMFHGKVLKGADANLANFLALAPKYAVLHLATHAKSNSYNGDYAYLVFGAAPEDSSETALLYVKDLYGQSWQADMAVLSACETGIGSFRPGEGVISLGRGFAQAGVRSTVNSLWSVNDARTSTLMQAFYTGLREGLPKDEALRRSKLAYLQGNSHEAAHPFYWASYLPFGDMAPLKLPTPFHWGYLLAGALLAACLFYLLRRRKRTT